MFKQHAARCQDQATASGTICLRKEAATSIRFHWFDGRKACDEGSMRTIASTGLVTRLRGQFRSGYRSSSVQLERIL